MISRTWKPLTMMGLSSYCHLFHFENNKHILLWTILINVCRSDSEKLCLSKDKPTLNSTYYWIFSLECPSICVIKVLKNHDNCKWDICIISMSYLLLFFLQIIIRYTNFNTKCFHFILKTLIHNTVWIPNIYRTIGQVSWIEPWLNSFNIYFTG